MNKNLPKIALGAWAWGDAEGYFGNTMTGEEFRPIFEAAMKAGITARRIQSDKLHTFAYYSCNCCFTV